MNAYLESISNEEINLLPTVMFTGRIDVINTAEEAEAACEYLALQPIIGFDTESKPSFKKGIINRIALLQLSSSDRAFLFRINQMPLVKPILNLLANPDVVKIGAAIRDDIRLLQQLRHFTPGGFVDLQNEVGKYGIQDKSLKKMAAITLGIKLSKAQRLSNWESPVLTPAQQNYAATDAWVSREIFVKLTRE